MEGTVPVTLKELDPWSCNFSSAPKPHAYTQQPQPLSWWQLTGVSVGQEVHGWPSHCQAAA